MATELERIILIAHHLERIGLTDAVFVGGAVIGLLITDAAAPVPRVTLDVDIVVDVNTRVSHAKLEQRLRDGGFSPVVEGPLCRWVIQDVLVDVMPVEESILGFSNR